MFHRYLGRPAFPDGYIIEVFEVFEKSKNNILYFRHIDMCIAKFILQYSEI
jgi:hypothetical protein